MTHYDIFTALHHQEEPLVLGNAWNAHSARLLEKNGFKAIGTSSAAVANTLGYEDGENISFEELLFVVKRIAKSINVPLSVDMERGYGKDTEEIVENIMQLHRAGAVGINIEDSMAEQDGNGITPVDVFSDRISTIKRKLAEQKASVFINARTDAYILNLPSALETTLERIKAYEKAGADGIFVPFVREVSAIQTITAAVSLPVNVLCIPEIPAIDQLAKLGVRRISLGTTGFKATYSHFDELLQSVQTERSFKPLFPGK